MGVYQESILLKVTDSPSWNLVFQDVAHVEIEKVIVTTNRTQDYDAEIRREDIYKNFLATREREERERRSIPDPGPGPGLQPEDLNTGT